jgi:DNA-binding MarR family transcriptional regulator
VPPARHRPVTRANLGFVLAKASQRWNEALYERFRRRGYPEVRPSYGSVLVPLFEEDGLRMGQLADRAGLSKQTLTTLVRLAERDGLVERRPDSEDGRATRVHLTPRGVGFERHAAAALAELDAILDERLGRRDSTQLAAGLDSLLAALDSAGRPPQAGRFAD